MIIRKRVNKWQNSEKDSKTDISQKTKLIKEEKFNTKLGN